MRLFNEYVLPFLRKFDSQIFRFTKLYKQTVDKVLKNHFQALREIYEIASSIDAVPDQDNVMSINEFTHFVISTLRGEEVRVINTRELGPMFNLSMMTHVDEIFNERYCQMTFIEFVEAFCRVADRIIHSDSVTSSLQSMKAKKASAQSDSPKSGGKPTQFGFGGVSSSVDSNGNLVPVATFHPGGPTGSGFPDFEALNVASSLTIEPNQPKDLTLEDKVNQYINRVIAKIMGKEYAGNYMDRAIKNSMASGTTVTQSQNILGPITLPSYK
jgi:hypothetical protein